MCNRRSHPTAGRGKRHFHVHFRSTLRPLGKLAIVYQSEIDDVHRDFRIETLLQLVPDHFFVDVAVARSDRLFRAVARCGFLEPERVRIFLRNARQALIGSDGITAAEGLGDYARRSLRNRRLCSTRDQNRFHVPRQSEFLVLVHNAPSYLSRTILILRSSDCAAFSCPSSVGPPGIRFASFGVSPASAERNAPSTNCAQ